jgi:hypothetical protein
MLGTDDFHPIGTQFWDRGEKSKAIKKKASALSSTGGGEAENSGPRKSKAKAKESDDVILDIDEALRHGDKLSTKTRP